MSLVALDLGQKTGWAKLIIAPHPRALKSGVLKLSPKDPTQLRYGNFLVFLRELIYEDDTVYYEQAQGAFRGAAAYWFGGLEAVLMIACLELNIVPRGVHPKTLKKATTGRGNALKPDMVAKARAVLTGFGEVTKVKLSHDEADAICLLWAASKGLV